MLEKERVYEIVSTLSNKKEREAVIRVMGILYAVYESGDTLATTDSRQIKKLLRLYRKDRGEVGEVIPTLSRWIDWLVTRSGLTVLKSTRLYLCGISQIIDQIGTVNLNSTHVISGKDVMSVRFYLNHADEIISKFLTSMGVNKGGI
jgi:hypothetical protein